MGIFRDTGVIFGLARELLLMCIPYGAQGDLL
jgi:hypothetical protein